MQPLTRMIVVALGLLMLGWAPCALAGTTTTVNGRRLTPAEQQAWDEQQRKEWLKHQLPPLKWFELEPGLAEAKSNSKPAAAVFCTKEYKGAATFDSAELRKALTASGAIPIRILPPEPPRVPAESTADDVKKLQEQYNETIKKYKQTLAKYSVTTGPTMVFLTADGDAVGELVIPTDQQVSQALANLPKTIEAFKAAKAKAEAEKAKAEAGKPAK